ncbi:C40 family peptidase [Fictibacillus sp. 7GRE50]|uniref:C40 family peptidase n=1 Tax=unclassified Fictibacillus TaxID=2644029 RepID=UPI0018CDB006|nr:MULTISPECIES: C40 family peptidase [unclassified Fictibacillus]MBH0164169.1 C40 family peptidase [Fictibacillus sp. 7GRE50]MBH0173703.1 C40 family peptidase [Fictibacillus sp. 23RED33]
MRFKANRLLAIIGCCLLAIVPLYPIDHNLSVDAMEKEDVLNRSLKLLGTPYKMGGEDPSGFDSSGFIQYVFKDTHDLLLPRTISEQNRVGTLVSKKDLKRGDVVFFSRENTKDLATHAGIYMGSNLFINAQSKKGVIISNLNDPYWQKSFKEGRRIALASKNINTLSVAQESLDYLGFPYKSGGDTVKGFDSSGFVQYVFENSMYFNIPRTIEKQWRLGKTVIEEQVKVGDLLYFYNDNKDKISHVGLYLGNDQFISSTVSNGVVISYWKKSDYWRSKYAGARRFQITNSNVPTIEEAKKYLGTPYIFGGETEAGFDCSGLVKFVHDHLTSMNLPRTAEKQWSVGSEITIDQIKPGDIVFFSNTYKKGISHNGIYIGENQFLHANRSKNVVVSYLEDTYWKGKLTGVKRFSK